MVLKNQIGKKQAIRMSSEAARRKLGKGTTVASLGAVRKGNNDVGTLVARVVFDGTHGVSINQAAKVRDQSAATGVMGCEGCDEGRRRRPRPGASSRG